MTQFYNLHYIQFEKKNTSQNTADEWLPCRTTFQTGTSQPSRMCYNKQGYFESQMRAEICVKSYTRMKCQGRVLLLPNSPKVAAITEYLVASLTKRVAEVQASSY